jgi:hypothetical protein
MPRQLLLATRKGLFTATESASGFRLGEPEFRGVPVSMMLPDPRDGALLVALDHGHFGVKLHRREPGTRSATWRELDAPSYPQLPDGEVEQDGFGRPWPRTLRLIWSLEIDPRTRGGLWCGTIPGGLFHSADGGAHWTFVEALWRDPGRAKWFGGGFDAPGIHSVLVDPRDANRVTLGISCGGVHRTDDGGRTWQNVANGMRAAFVPDERAADVDVQDPHRLAQCAAVPDRQWCQHHNGIFVRRAEGEPWRELDAPEPSSFGFACAAHPRDPDVAWFVPAEQDECRVPIGGRVVVTRTTNGGRSFDMLSRGLPQRDAYDLVYRHGLEVAADGSTLAMGSTTGHVWIGRDGGEQWQQLDAQLPPIAAVRWLEQR